MPWTSSNEWYGDDSDLRRIVGSYAAGPPENFVSTGATSPAAAGSPASAGFWSQLGNIGRAAVQAAGALAAPGGNVGTDAQVREALGMRPPVGLTQAQARAMYPRSGAPKYKRMNVANIRALTRAMRRVKGFVKVARRAVSFDRAVKMRSSRRK